MVLFVRSFAAVIPWFTTKERPYMITTASTFSISGVAMVNASKTYFSKNADNNGNDVVININAKYRKIMNLLDSKIRFQE